jgi:hypothetical protein
MVTKTLLCSGTILVLIAAAFVGGCASHTDSNTDDDTTPIEEKITPVSVSITGGTISFTGHTVLPDGTYLRTQLYADDNPEAWWPADEYIQVQDGQWQISVRLGENGAPENLEVGPLYVIEVWEDGNPSVMAEFHFDLIGPAEVQ